MLIKEVKARIIEDSRGDKTIAVSVNKCEEASSPNGKSRGEYETPSYYKSIEFCVKFLNEWNDSVEIERFDDLIYVEKIICKKLKLKRANQFGANALYAFESAILKALAHEKKKELYEIVGNNKKIPYIVGNVIGGGMHSSIVKKHPDFQEFVVIPKSSKLDVNLKIMNYIYTSIKKDLGTSKVNDEGAWLATCRDSEAFDVLNNFRFKAEKKFKAKVEIGIDAASSTLYKSGLYNYSDSKYDSFKQLKFMQEIILNHELGYLEDPFEEHDFRNFAKLQKKVGRVCLIVGDDLTATQYERTKKAIKKGSINAMIIKPNQNGSLLELKRIIEMCKKHGIKTVMSHRSGETMDDALADYAVGFGADYIKCGVATKWREVKLERLKEIEKRL